MTTLYTTHHVQSYSFFVLSYYHPPLHSFPTRRSSDLFSRLPVRDGSGKVLGYLHVKDVLYADETSRTTPIPHWRVRALATVSTDTEIEEVLRAMQRSGTHLAGVVAATGDLVGGRSEEHTSELQSRRHLVCRLLLEK